MTAYKKLLSKIAIFLKSEGYKKRGDTFLIQKCGNWELINFQKSRYNATKGQTQFTINTGICSSLVRQYLERDIETCPNDIEDCHWRKRIGFFMPDRQDFWWEINDTVSLDALENELIKLFLEKVIPEMDLYVSDESLEEMWLSENSEGLTEVERYVFLTTLLKIKEKKSLFSVAIQFKKFAKGKSYEVTAAEHLKELGINE